jgi:uncharacterized membrane protein YfcA
MLDPTLIIACAIIFGAAVVRGFTGFGFSLLTISALSLFYPLPEIVPTIFLMELAASLNLLPAIWKDIHWRSLLPLIIGAAIGTPLGVWALAHYAGPGMQLALAAFILLAVSLMWRGFGLKSMPGPVSTTAAGAASGLANGAFGIGGPPAVLFYFSSPAGNAEARASIIAYFLATDSMGLVTLSGMANLVTLQTAIRAAIYLPFLVAGIWIGHRSFKGVDEGKFRKAVLALLGVMALMIGAKALAALWA